MGGPHVLHSPKFKSEEPGPKDKKELLKELDMKEILELDKKETMKEILGLDKKEPRKEMDIAISAGEQKLTDPGANHSKKQDEGWLEELDKKELLEGLDMKDILELD